MQTRKALVLVFVSAGAIVLAAMNTGSHDDDRDVHPVIELPPRKPAPPGTLPRTPALPGNANDVPAMTFRVISTFDGPKGRRRRATQVVTRTADRVRLVLEGSQKEWLFERNPVDQHRVSGYLVDHAARQILEYQEHDLSAREHFRGWADVLMMRFDPAVLTTTLDAAGDGTYPGGLTFSRYIARDSAREGVVEVWWNDKFLLPLRQVVRDSGMTMTSAVDALTERVDYALLGDPRLRFPDYEVLGAADAADTRH